MGFEPMVLNLQFRALNQLGYEVKLNNKKREPSYHDSSLFSASLSFQKKMTIYQITIWLTIFNCNTTRPTLSTNVGLNATWWNCPIHISLHNFYATFLNNINKGNLSSLNAISYDNTLYNIMQVFFLKKNSYIKQIIFENLKY